MTSFLMDWPISGYLNVLTHHLGLNLRTPNPHKSVSYSIIQKGLTLILISNKICFLQDQHWAFSDIRTGQLITKVTDGGDGSGGAALTSAQFHPDGLILGTGTSDAQIKIWDLKEVSSYSRKRNLA